MAERTGEKQHAPTAHRRAEARRQGHVAKSQDLSSAVLLLVALVVLLLTGSVIATFFANFMSSQLGSQAWQGADSTTITGGIVDLGWQVSRLVLPLMAMIFIAAVLANLGQIGFLFNLDRIAPKWSRISPVEGLGRVVSLSGLARLAFGLFKILVILSIGLIAVYLRRETFLNLSNLSAAQIGLFLAETTVWAGLQIGIGLLVLALLEFGFQRWKYERDLMMTTEELREEIRNTEGDPELRARRRDMQRELAESNRKNPHQEK
jgi:flagellar biosynthesis protein FlhB